jgi:lipopolysaccharide export system permease protein
VLVIGATLGLVLLGDIYDSLPDLLALGVSSEELVQFYLSGIPARLPLLLPVALLFSVLFSMGQLHRNHEITALRAAGHSPFRIARPLWAVGIAFSCVVFFLQASWVPWSVERSRFLEDQFLFRHQQEALEEQDVGVAYNVRFDNRADQRIWAMNRFSLRTLQGHGVTVHVLNPDRSEIQRIQAREAYFDYLEHKAWVFHEGRVLTFNPETHELVASESFDHRLFPSIQENPQLMLALIKQPKDLSLRELDLLIQELPAPDQPYRDAYLTRYSAIWASSVTCLLAVALAVPFAIRGVRVNPASNIARAIILFFIYYFINNFSLLLGERSLLTPAIAAWAPNVLGLIFAIGLLWRSQK